MTRVITDPIETKRTIELIWLAKDINDTIEQAMREMRAADFDWRSLGLAGPSSWETIRRAMLRWAIDQQIYQQEQSGEDDDRRIRDRSASRPGPFGRREPNNRVTPRSVALAL
jgi:hypothetical protein